MAKALSVELNIVTDLLPCLATGNPAWARFAVADGGTMPGLVLGYGNQRVWVGTQLGEEERLLLAQQMATVFHRR